MICCSSRGVQVPLFVLQPLRDGWMFGHCSSPKGSGGDHGVAAPRNKNSDGGGGSSGHSAHFTHAALRLRNTSHHSLSLPQPLHHSSVAAAAAAAAEALDRAHNFMSQSGVRGLLPEQILAHLDRAAAAIDEAQDFFALAEQEGMHVTFEECVWAYRESMRAALEQVAGWTHGAAGGCGGERSAMRRVFSPDTDEHCTTVQTASHVTRTHVTRTHVTSTHVTSTHSASRVTQVYDLDDWLERGGGDLNEWVVMHMTEGQGVGGNETCSAA